jgi:predicted nucleic acid-binding protein
MKRTFIDSGVLIAAARGNDEVARKAMAILDDPEREFASSVFVKLEVLPKAVYHRMQAEAEFYHTYFDAVTSWAESLDGLVAEAYTEACNSGVAAMDALHIAAAESVGATELITTEKAERPIHRTHRVKVISINS